MQSHDVLSTGGVVASSRRHNHQKKKPPPQDGHHGPHPEPPGKGQHSEDKTIGGHPHHTGGKNRPGLAPPRLVAPKSFGACGSQADAVLASHGHWAWTSGLDPLSGSAWLRRMGGISHLALTGQGLLALEGGRQIGAAGHVFFAHGGFLLQLFKQVAFRRPVLPVTTCAQIL